MPQENKHSTLLSLEENQRISQLQGARCKTLATTTVQLFHMQQQSLKKETGVLCFIKDNIKRNYFFRLFCLQRNCMIWEQEIYNGMVYLKTCPNLHTFEGDESMIALSFVSKEEANELYKIVTAKLLMGRKREEAKKAKLKRNNTKADIGQPLEFRHISHISWDRDEGFTFKTVDKQLHKFFCKAGVSEKDMQNFIYDFIEKNGERDVIERNITKKPTPPRSAGQTDPPRGIMGEAKKVKPKRKITKADIGQPFQFRHISHVSWDPDEGFTFNTRDQQLYDSIQEDGGSEKHLQNFIYNFIQKNGERDVIERNITKKPPPPPPTTQTCSPLSSSGSTRTVHKRTDPPPPSATPPRPQPQPPRSIMKEAKKTKRKITKADIGQPTKFRHIFHIGWDFNEGFKCHTSDEQLQEFFNEAGVPEEHFQDTDIRNFIYDFIKKNGERDVIERNNTKERAPPRPPLPPKLQLKPPRGILLRPPKNAPPPPPPLNGSRPLPSAPPTPPLPPPLTRLLPPSTDDNQGDLCFTFMDRIREDTAMNEREIKPLLPIDEGVNLAVALKRALVKRKRLMHPDDDDEWK